MGIFALFGFAFLRRSRPVLPVLVVSAAARRAYSGPETSNLVRGLR